MNKGLVTQTTGNWNIVTSDTGQTFKCRIKGNFRTKELKTTHPIAVGDIVDFKIIDSENTGLIFNIRKRKNYIIRKASKLSKQYQILAANIDQGILIVTIKQPITTTIFIDRFLISAEAYRIPVSIIFNKIDIYNNTDNQKLNEQINVYEKIGYKCYQTSVKENTNIETLKKILQNKITIVSGHSGVGKSSFINAIDTRLSLKMAEISEHHLMGKHTTTFSQMFQLSSGGYLIDTPGIKGFGLIDMQKNEISHYFPELFKASSQCRYNNCTHTDEPHCAVLKSLENGNISPSRYKSYINILENEGKYKNMKTPHR